jgi:hypothetical protein
MFTAVATEIPQIVTDLSKDESEEDSVMTIRNIVLKLMKRKSR